MIARGERLTVDAVETAMESAKEGLDQQLESFARNTLEYMSSEKALLTEGVSAPVTKTVIAGGTRSWSCAATITRKTFGRLPPTFVRSDRFSSVSTVVRTPFATSGSGPTSSSVTWIP